MKLNKVLPDVMDKINKIKNEIEDDYDFENYNYRNFVSYISNRIHEREDIAIIYTDIKCPIELYEIITINEDGKIVVYVESLIIGDKEPLNPFKRKYLFKNPKSVIEKHILPNKLSINDILETDKYIVV